MNIMAVKDIVTLEKYLGQNKYGIKLFRFLKFEFLIFFSCSVYFVENFVILSGIIVPLGRYKTKMFTLSDINNTCFVNGYIRNLNWLV